jgi:hypothetical protein
MARWHFRYEAPFKLGSELTPSERRDVLSTFVHRFTRDRIPAWARQTRTDATLYPVQFDSDADWLAHTRFNVTAKGALDRRVSECHSTPTWPDNPELRIGARLHPSSPASHA